MCVCVCVRAGGRACVYVCYTDTLVHARPIILVKSLLYFILEMHIVVTIELDRSVDSPGLL